MAVGNPYTEVSIVDYNVTPPTDDGAQTGPNTVTWSFHKTKLADPIKTLAETTQTSITAALDKRVMNNRLDKTGAYTIATTDRGKIVNFTGTGAATFTLPVAADAKVGFEIITVNAGTAVLTVDGNAAETVDGAATIELYPGQKAWLFCDGTAWDVTVRNPRPGVVSITNSDSPYTIIADHDGRVIDVDASGGAVTINLPPAATAKNGFSITVKKTDSSLNAVTVDADDSETIDGSLTRLLTSQYQGVILVCDSTEWHVSSLSRTDNALVLLATATASASTSIDFTDLPTIYDQLMVSIIGVRPVSDNVEFEALLSTDNGSTFITAGSSYEGAIGTNSFASEPNNRMLLSSDTPPFQITNVAGNHLDMLVDIFKPTDAGVKTKVTNSRHASHVNENENGWVQEARTYRRAASEDNDAIRFKFNTGNISEGEFYLYGVQKS